MCRICSECYYDEVISACSHVIYISDRFTNLKEVSVMRDAIKYSGNAVVNNGILTTFIRLGNYFVNPKKLNQVNELIRELELNLGYTQYSVTKNINTSDQELNEKINQMKEYEQYLIQADKKLDEKINQMKEYEQYLNEEDKKLNGKINQMQVYEQYINEEDKKLNGKINQMQVYEQYLNEGDKKLNEKINQIEGYDQYLIHLEANRKFLEAMRKEQEAYSMRKEQAETDRSRQEQAEANRKILEAQELDLIEY
jgi:chromosome segregation ATPase